MPKIQSLSVTFDIEPYNLFVSNSTNDQPTLPNLTHLNLEIEAVTSDDTITHLCPLSISRK